jgi:glutathione peroxidase
VIALQGVEGIFERAGIAGEIKWNFTKFLVYPNGKVVQRFEPAVTPDSKEVTGAIEKLVK